MSVLGRVRDAIRREPYVVVVMMVTLVGMCATLVGLMFWWAPWSAVMVSGVLLVAAGLKWWAR